MLVFSLDGSYISFHDVSKKKVEKENSRTQFNDVHCMSSDLLCFYEYRLSSNTVT